MTIRSSFTEFRRQVSICGVQFDYIDEAGVVSRIIDDIRNGLGGWVLTVNADILRRIHSKKVAGLDWKSATLVVADGMPIIWSSYLASNPLPERVAGSSLIWSVSRAASQNDASIFLLGGNPHTAERAATVLRGSYPSLRIAGTYCPAYGFELDPTSFSKAISAVIETNPSVCFCGLGFPKQEILITELRKHLPQTWFLGVGISISMVAGEFRRAPSWVQRAGFEWLTRLAQEPTRLAVRYLIYDVPFVGRMLGLSMVEGVRRKFYRALG